MSVFVCCMRLRSFVSHVCLADLSIFIFLTTQKIKEHKNFFSHDINSRSFGKLPKLAIIVSRNQLRQSVFH